jgi:hypothetical protein
MLNNISLIVLTENIWLFEGLSALLPDMCCYRVGFDAILPERRGDDCLRVIIAVDCRILFRDQEKSKRETMPEMKTIGIDLTVSET